MITLDELMTQRRTILMELMRDKRCTSAQGALGTALNQVTDWLRNGKRDDLAAFNAVYDEACRAIDDALEIALVPLDVAIHRSRPSKPAWLNKRGAA